MATYSTLDDLKAAINSTIKNNGGREITATQMNDLLLGIVGFVTGATGLSAYQIAVKNGYTGTEADWIASLKGDTGDAGSTAEWVNGNKSVTATSETQLVVELPDVPVSSSLTISIFDSSIPSSNYTIAAKTITITGFDFVIGVVYTVYYKYQITSE